MKSLDQYIGEGILDADFDIPDDDIYALNVTNKLIEIIQNPEVTDVEKLYNDVSYLLTSIASLQRADKTSIMKKMRMKDNTCIWIIKLPYEDHPFRIHIRRFIQNPRPMEITLTPTILWDGKVRMSVSGPTKCNHLSNISPHVAKTIVFLNTEVWDKIIKELK